MLVSCTGRSSFVVLLLALLMGTGAMLACVFGALDVVTKLEDGGSGLGFKDVCLGY